MVGENVEEKKTYCNTHLGWLFKIPLEHYQYWKYEIWCERTVKSDGSRENPRGPLNFCTSSKHFGQRLSLGIETVVMLMQNSRST